MEIEIQGVDNLCVATINGIKLTNIIDYKVKTSAKGDTEVTLKFKIADTTKSIVLSDN